MLTRIVKNQNRNEKMKTKNEKVKNPPPSYVLKIERMSSVPSGAAVTVCEVCVASVMSACGAFCAWLSDHRIGHDNRVVIFSCYLCTNGDSFVDVFRLLAGAVDYKATLTISGRGDRNYPRVFNFSK